MFSFYIFTGLTVSSQDGCFVFKAARQQRFQEFVSAVLCSWPHQRQRRIHHRCRAPKSMRFQQYFHLRHASRTLRSTSRWKARAHGEFHSAVPSSMLRWLDTPCHCIELHPLRARYRPLFSCTALKLLTAPKIARSATHQPALHTSTSHQHYQRKLPAALHTRALHSNTTHSNTTHSSTLRHTLVRLVGLHRAVRGSIVGVGCDQELLDPLVAGAAIVCQHPPAVD